ncbi:MAG: molybdopterin-dependent oxidoreductase [Chloroflexota bacterium]|nr:molybdopterin-dependent oxidoreductase [Chloroflexota bacterium]
MSKGTHLLNCWYQRNCAYNVYVKDGAVAFEEASGTYPQTNPSVPDFNPRGCQKGACYSLTMRDEARLTHPLKRAGARGDGRWQQVSWDEALGDIADHMVDALARDAPEAIVFDGNAAGVASFVAMNRFANLLGATVLDLNTEVGDEQQGAAVTFGVPVASRSADDYFNSDLILIWGGNPAYTQIPNFHFLNEARYNGARVIAISPDFNASAAHADRWISVRPGTDAALALAMAQVIIAEGLADKGFVREQTDLPFLVRTDTGRFLRESDLRRRGRDDAFSFYDTASGRPLKASQKTLRLAGAVPALEGAYDVRTRDGPVKVKPVFQVLKERLDRDDTPEQASAVCGVHPDVIRGLAREFAGARAASGVAGASISKYYHGDLMMRAQILLFALCGQMGRKGAGYDALPFFIVDGTLGMPYQAGLGRLDALRLMAPAIPAFIGMKMKGYSNELAMFQLGRKMSVWGGASAVMFWYQHGGLRKFSGRSREWDPYLTKDVDEYLADSVRRGWQAPAPATPPKVLFACGSNPLRRVRGGHRLFEELLPKLDLLVATDIRMSTTALNADYVLPAAASYEKTDVNDWYTPLAPFAHVTTAAVQPPGEAKPEWEIMVLLAEKVEERARARGLTSYAAGGRRRRLGGLVHRMTFRGAFTARDHEKVAEAVVNASTHLGTPRWAEFKKKGFRRFTSLGSHPGNRSNASDLREGETFTPHTWRTEKKMPWPTLTRRIQFYIDQPLYLELGEELPVHKEPVMSGGDYPLVMTGGHNRHSIHASFRTNPLMLQLERGEPAIFISKADARERGIANGDRVRVKNDIGSFLIRAKVAASVRPGQVIVYHAWENYQFEGGIGHRNVIATPMNPVELAGGYFHIQPAPAILQPGHNDRDTRVEVEKAP